MTDKSKQRNKTVLLEVRVIIKNNEFDFQVAEIENGKKNQAHLFKLNIFSKTKNFKSSTL